MNPDSPDKKVPTWVDTASNDAVITSVELRQWLGIRSVQGFKSMLEINPDFPKPLFPGRGGRPSRWRVGDVRAWMRKEEPAPPKAHRRAFVEPGIRGGFEW